jgi:uncharacterized protein (TIGR03382 family)
MTQMVFYRRHGVVMSILVSTLLLMSADSLAETWTVNADSSGDFSTIQAAIDVAVDGDEIHVGPGTYNDGINFSGKSVALIGSGRTETILDGAGDSEVFIRLESGETSATRIESLTITNAWNQGVLIDGASPQFDDVLFSGMGNDEEFGGAMTIVNGFVAISNSEFRDNRAYDGGAIYLSGTSSIMIDTTLFESNLANGYTEEVLGEELDEETGEMVEVTIIQQRWGRGGAIHMSGSSNLNVADTEFIDNDSQWGGGALCVRTIDGTVTLTDVIWEDNSSSRGGGGAILMWMDDDDMDEMELVEFAEIFGTLLIERNEFAGNKSLRSNGGAIYMDGDYQAPLRIEVTDSEFIYNEASSSGGAISLSGLYDEFILTNTDLTINEGRNGGAIYLASQLLFTGTFLDISSNTASDAGGALYASSSVMINMEDVTIHGNRARNYYGGGIYATNFDATYPSRLERVSFKDNSSKLEGGGAHFRNVSNSTFQECLFEGNEAGSNSFGGGLYADDSAYVKVRNSVFRSNTAHYGGGAYINDNADGSDFYNNVFLDNDARTGGGFALCNSPYTLFFNNSVVGNRAMHESGGAAFFNSWVEFRNNIFAFNTGGAALHMYDENSAFYAQLEYNNFYGNDPMDITGELDSSVLDEGNNFRVDPQFSWFAGDMPGDEVSLVLAPSSPMIDAGDPMIPDPDGTDSDIGAYGGDMLRVSDLDGDGFDSSKDCDDTDPSINPAASETWYDGINSDCSYGSDFDADGDGADSDSWGGIDCDDTDASLVDADDCDEPGDTGATEPEEEQEEEEESGEEDVEEEDEPRASTSGSLKGAGSCSTTGSISGAWAWVLLGLVGLRRRSS